VTVVFFLSAVYNNGRPSSTAQNLRDAATQVKEEKQVQSAPTKVV